MRCVPSAAARAGLPTSSSPCSSTITGRVSAACSCSISIAVSIITTPDFISKTPGPHTRSRVDSNGMVRRVPTGQTVSRWPSSRVGLPLVFFWPRADARGPKRISSELPWFLKRWVFTRPLSAEAHSATCAEARSTAALSELGDSIATSARRWFSICGSSALARTRSCRGRRTAVVCGFTVFTLSRLGTNVILIPARKPPFLKEQRSRSFVAKAPQYDAISGILEFPRAPYAWVSVAYHRAAFIQCLLAGNPHANARSRLDVPRGTFGSRVIQHGRLSIGNLCNSVRRNRACLYPFGRRRLKRMQHAAERTPPAGECA